MRASREGKCDDGRFSARAAFDQVGPAGGAGLDAVVLRDEGCLCKPEGLGRWVVAGRFAECGGDGEGYCRGYACSLRRGTKR